MRWDLDAVIAAISAYPQPGQGADSLLLPVYSETEGIGVGVDAEGTAVLVLPGQDAVAGYATAAVMFEPWCDAMWLEEQRALPKSAVLRCVFERSDAYVASLVASVFVGLIDLQLRFGDAAKAIHRLKELFGSGFGSGPDLATIRGLLGELVVITAASDRVRALENWHVDAESRYDFSKDSLRVEVKSTSGAVRQHRFTSRQLPALPGIEAHVVSVLIPEVSVGVSVADLCRDLERVLPEQQRRKLVDVIVETVGLPPRAVSLPMIDLDSAVASIRTYSAYDVPTPELVPGVSDLRWSAFLRDDKGRQGLTTVSIFGGTEHGG